jgi:hypothetical protein
MSPILTGVIASGISGNLIGPSSFESIATTTLGSDNTITFGTIPTTFQHLQLRISGKTNRPTYNNDLVSLRFNGDTSSNYRYFHMKGTGSGALSLENGSSSASTKLYSVGHIGDTVNNSSNFGYAVVDILDYNLSTKVKTIRSISGYDANGGGTDPGIISFNGGLWQSTNAITSITLLPAEGSNLVSGTSIALYGIKG